MPCVFINKRQLISDSLLDPFNMTKYNFEGDIENINERQLEYIYNVIVELGFENSKVVLEPVGIAGDNYSSCVKRIIIESDNRKMNMIAKIAPSIDIYRQLLKVDVLFRNEHIMYTEVLPKLVQVQKDAGIPEKQQFRYAKCYGSFSESPNEVILLEDLKVSNFVMLDRFASFSNECVRSVLKNFAILHSLSYALKYMAPEIFENFKSNLTDIWVLNASVEEMKIFFQGIEDDTLAVLEDPDHVNLLRHKISDVMNMALKLSKADYDSRYTVIQQGDSWTNNIMFRFEDEKLTESILVDYQISKNSSPVSDIMYMIFNCTDYETRKQHYYDWIDFYHSELEESLSNYNLKVNFVYPKDKLDADLKRYGKNIFGMCTCLASMLIRKSADVEKMMDSIKSEDVDIMAQQQQFSVAQLDRESMTLYKKRIMGLINSFIEFGLL